MRNSHHAKREKQRSDRANPVCDGECRGESNSPPTRGRGDSNRDHRGEPNQHRNAIEIWSAKHQYDVTALLAHLKGEGNKTKGLS